MTSAKRTKTKKTEERSSKKKALSSTAQKKTKAAQKTVKPAPKKSAGEKTVAKKTSQKKTVSKKTSPAVKKKTETTKKSSVKKSKSSAKSTTTSKTAAKKVTAKKAAPKTAVKKKSADAIKKSPKVKLTQVKKASNKKTVEKKSSSKSKKTASKTLIEFPTTNWGTDSVISFEATNHLPPAHLTSISGGFVFHDGNVVLANIPGRGWEVIGGRIDIGETPEETFRRETMNQIGVSLAHVEQIGVIRIEHLGPEPPNCPYPFPVGYGVQYIGIVDELTPFGGSDESLGRSLISYEGFKEHYYDWNEYYEAVFNYAYSVYKKLRKKLKI